MRRSGSQQGEGKAGCLFWILVLLILALVGSKVIPTKIKTMELKDFMEELAMRPVDMTQDTYEREIHHRAQELRLEIPRKQIKVKKYPQRVIMDIQFVVPVDLLVTTYDWDVKIYLDRDIFIF